MYKSPRFSCGLELASLAVSSNVLSHSAVAISELYSSEVNEPASALSSVKFKISHHPNFTILAFITCPPCTKEHLEAAGGGALVSSSILEETFPLFQFLCTKTNPQFSINSIALNLFSTIRGSLQFLQSQLMQVSDSKTSIKPIIITGHSLGGSVASLFTLWLLNEIDFATAKRPRPLCVTFGSPLIGDEGLQEAISKYSAWNSCFLHVVADQDPVPRVLIANYKPFGIFLFYSVLGCACVEDPESVLKLLMATYTLGPGNQIPNQFVEYGTIVKELNNKIICKDCTRGDECITQLGLAGNDISPLRTGIITQLAAIGLGRAQNIDYSLVSQIEKQERKLLMRIEFPDADLLNEMKIAMANLEWYKKVWKEKGIGYYDRYKNPRDRSDQDAERFVKRLTAYWMDTVDEVEKKPQKEGAAFRTRWMFAGTNYRRMVEPLRIADYYSSGRIDYIAKGRHKHFDQLEKWLNNEGKPVSSTNNSKKQNVAANLTEDSCFWAHVEEALILCKALSGREPGDVNRHRKNLIEFEDYVWRALKNYAVSPEIFLQDSSFMKWWEEYKKIIKETPYSSPLTELMKTRQYRQYATGCL